MNLDLHRVDFVRQVGPDQQGGQPVVCAVGVETRDDLRRFVVQGDEDLAAVRTDDVVDRAPRPLEAERDRFTRLAQPP
jgi:hypothetical protein